MLTRKKDAFSIQQVLDELNNDDSDFSQGDCSDDSVDEEEFYASVQLPDAFSDAEISSSNKDTDEAGNLAVDNFLLVMGIA